MPDIEFINRVVSSFFCFRPRRRHFLPIYSKHYLTVCRTKKLKIKITTTSKRTKTKRCPPVYLPLNSVSFTFLLFNTSHTFTPNHPAQIQYRKHFLEKINFHIRMSGFFTCRVEDGG